jgi:hypothetical protein
MKTLYERLKPELLINLNKNTEEYSDSVVRVTKILQNNSFYSDLTISEVDSINTFCEVDLCYVTLFMFRFGKHLFNEE